MTTKFIDTVEKYNMFSPGQKVIVGLSGGADSMCLVSLLQKYSSSLGITVEAAHVNHCIRGEEAKRDERFVREYCERSGIKVHILSADIPAIAAKTGESTELCARRIRYEFFDSLKADVIATAHTGSDRIETMLMNLSRGASLSGLCSIPPVRGNVVRPLIGILRNEVEEYCAAEKIEFITDSTNLTNEYTRNKFRHNVVTELVNINPSFEKNALRCIENLNDDEMHLVSQSNDAYKSLINQDGSLNITDIYRFDTSIRRRIIKLFIEKKICTDFEMKHIESILASLGKSFSIVLPGAVRLSGNKEKLYYDEITDAKDSYDDEFLKKGEKILCIREDKNLSLDWADFLPGDITNCYVADADKIGDELSVRTRRAGDVFHLGKRHCSKSLKKLFNEMKIPVKDRDSLFVISDDSGLIFLESIGTDAKREVDQQTKNFLIIKMESGKNNE